MLFIMVAQVVVVSLLLRTINRIPTLRFGITPSEVAKRLPRLEATPSLLTKDLPVFDISSRSTLGLIG